MVVPTTLPESEPMLDAQKVRKNPLTEEAYKNITSSMRAEPLQIESTDTALQLLSTAIQLRNMPLVNECIKNLDEHLNKDNVLMIYSYLSKCKMPISNKHDFEPSAPPIIENENQRGTDWVQELVNNLRHNCLLMIDKEADYILRKKEVVKLSYNDVYNILSRDTLEVSSEIIVYTAMYNWGMEECSRMTLNTHHIQEVLRLLRFTPRYGLMTKKEFKGPIKSGVLDEKEWRAIRFYIEQKAKQKKVEELKEKMSTERLVGKERPKILSSKSSSRYESSSYGKSNANCSKLTCEKCLLNFLSCWTAIFD